jgi:uncharacterized membrane protein
MAHVEKSIEVKKPVDEVYSQWTQFEEFPRFMENVEEVRQLDDKHLEWKAKIWGSDRRWKAEIVEQKPNQVIAWRSTSGERNNGTVHFQPTDGQTKVTLMLDYEAPGGGIGETGDKLLQTTAGQVEGDLKRFKKFIEERPGPTGAWKGEIDPSGKVKH